MDYTGSECSSAPGDESRWCQRSQRRMHTAGRELHHNLTREVLGAAEAGHRLNV